MSVTNTQANNYTGGAPQYQAHGFQQAADGLAGADR